MDIKAKVDEIAKKIMGDKTLLSRFQKEPTKVVEEVVGIDLPNEQIDPVVKAVKAKIDVNNVGNLLGGLLKK